MMSTGFGKRRATAGWRVLAGATVAAGLLAGCVSTPEQSGAASQLQATPVAEAAAPRIALAPPAPPPAPAPDPAQLVGLNRVALSALLGEPALRREEPPAEVWLYKSDSCAFHVYLYPDEGDGNYRVTHYDAVHRLRRVNLTAADRCFEHLMVRADALQRTG